MPLLRRRLGQPNTVLTGAALFGALLFSGTGTARVEAQAPQTVEADIFSTLPSTDTHRPEMALDGDPGTYFQSTRGMGRGDDFLVLFTSPIPVQSIKVTTGDDAKGGLFTQGLLETSSDGKTFTQAAAFGADGTAATTAAPGTVQAVRLTVPRGTRGGMLVIREITITTPVKITHIGWARGRGFYDVSQAPDVLPWAERAEKQMEEFWPNTEALLYSEGNIPPNMVNVVYRDGDGVAATGGGVMTVNSKWCRAHPEDTGLTVHETAHVVQSYPGYGAGWLVEGIADYIRWCKFEPEHFHPRINPAKATYHDSYQTTAAFLLWCEQNYDSGLVTKLNRALRAGTFSIDMFKQYCGKDVDTLWAEFIKTLPPPPAPKV
jgi:hypothetical protein